MSADEPKSRDEPQHQTWKCPHCGGEVCGTRLVRHYYALNGNGGLAHEYEADQDDEQEAYACRGCERTWEEWEDVIESVFDIADEEGP